MRKIKCAVCGTVYETESTNSNTVHYRAVKQHEKSSEKSGNPNRKMRTIIGIIPECTGELIKKHDRKRIPFKNPVSNGCC